MGTQVSSVAWVPFLLPTRRADENREESMETRRISDIVIGERFRKDLGDIQSLAESIREVGLLHPVVITRDGMLVAGQRRIEACKALGWEKVPVTVVDLHDILRGEHDENVARKDFLPSEAVAIYRAMKPIEEAAARERHVAQAKANLGVADAGNFPASEKGRVREKVARYVGVSDRTLEKAAKVVEAAEREPEKFAPLVEQMDRTGKVNGVYKRLEVLQKAEEISKEQPPLPRGPFRVIVADPPWPYEKRAEDATHRAALPYPSMTLDDIKGMPVRHLAHEDAILWLWTTNAHMREAYEVVDAWGFEPKTILTWAKDRMGTGDWLRGQTEHCILAVRGRPVVTLTSQTTLLYAPVREHSRKPDEFYRLVESLCPGSKVELFARQEREGWVSHGNETDRFSAEGRRSA